MEHPAISQVHQAGPCGDGCLGWWMFGVVDVLGGACLGRWMFGVVHVWGGARPIWQGGGLRGR